MFGKRLALIIAAALALGAAAPALAQERGRDHERGEGRGRDHGEWRDRDIARFHEHDFDRWRGGGWRHERHDGRLGWWWVVGPNWYYYPRAVYPYPDPYVPPYAVAGAPAWYYCPPAQTYYPYVATCPVPWQVVPAR